MIKKKKPISKTKIRNKIDKLWSGIVRSLGNCQVCGKSDYLNAHHIIGRTDLRTRWDLRNGICLCSGCHTMNNQSAHNNPLWFMEWMREHRGEDFIYLHEKMKESPRPYSVLDYLEIEKELKSRLS
jgi:hypothetical protein